MYFTLLHLVMQIQQREAINFKTQSKTKSSLLPRSCVGDDTCCFTLTDVVKNLDGKLLL